jgi:RNA polymerase sigma factor (sigma-70 family)
MTPLNAHERAEMHALIESEWPKLERFFRSKVPPGEIQDLAQNTLLGFVRRGDVPPDKQRAYLWTIARRQVVDYYRRGNRRGVSFDSSVHAVAQGGTTMSSLFNRRNDVMRVIQTLPLDHQTALELKYGEGLTDPEAALALEVSLATYKRYVAAALGVLREGHGLEGEKLVGAAYQGR